MIYVMDMTVRSKAEPAVSRCWTNRQMSVQMDGWTDRREETDEGMSHNILQNEGKMMTSVIRHVHQCGL